MAKKKGRSEKKKDWLGRPYIQHYDAKGNKSGRSEGKETFFGSKYTQHYDAKGNKAGKSEQKETLLGSKYTQKYDSRGNKSGTSEKKTTWLGSKYKQHYDIRHNKTDRSEEKETLFGRKYIQRYGDENPKPSNPTLHSHLDNSRASGSSHSYSGLTTSIASETANRPNIPNHSVRTAHSRTSSTAVLISIAVVVLIIISVRNTLLPSRTSIVDVRTYQGKIDDKYPIKMNLQKQGTTVSGTYVYLKYNKPLQLHGTVDSNGAITVYGYDGGGTLIDIFRGTLGSNQEITGQFTRQKDMKVMPFQLKESEP